MLNRKRSVRLPTPPPFRNHGNYVVSVAELARWMGERAEEAGAYVLSETVGAQAAGRGRRVRRRPHGRQGARQGGRREVELRARLRRASPRRPCSPRAAGGTSPARRSRASGSPRTDPQVWALGVKEVWEVPTAADRVIHTLGWPLRTQAKYKEFGGSWIYPMNREGEDRVSIGFVVGLDYADARLSVHDVLQEFKGHPLVRRILEGGKRVAWGAKAIPEGGYWAMPRLRAPGMVDLRRRRRHGQRAEAQGHPLRDPLRDARRGDDLPALKGARATSSAYDDAVHDSVIGKDLYESRNMKQPFAKGFFVGGAITNAMVVTKGRFPAATGRRTATPTSRCCRPTATSAIPSRTASTRSTSSPASSSPATRRATTRRATSASSSACRASWPRRGSGCARRASTRCPRTPRRTAPRRPDREPLELRAVRGDHGQGRAPDAARGRRRAGLPGHLASGAAPRG